MSQPAALQRRRVAAHGVDRLLAGLDQRHELGARDGGEADACVERADEVVIAAGGDRRLRREQADPAVARRAHGRGGLGRDHADHRHGQATTAAPGSAAEVAALQATTISFTPCRSR